jgi:hypothetical protein
MIDYTSFFVVLVLVLVRCYRAACVGVAVATRGEWRIRRHC